MESKKQSAVEELAKEFYSDENQLIERIAFKRGYTECEEKMYSEEDIKKLFKRYREEFSMYRNLILYDHFDKWFEQFKKK